MKKFEYRTSSPHFYKQCLTKANLLLDQISETLKKPKIKITPLDIIFYFEMNYNILFTFFESTPSHKINKFEALVQNSNFEFVNKKMVNRLAGVTIPKNGRIVIMINQTMPRSRVIYTILHELCHLYFHNMEANKRIFASKFYGNYPDKILPYEDEANIIASILFCPTDKLESLFYKNYSFSKIILVTNMSHKALHNRLMNYLYHILKLPRPLALELVLGLKNNNHLASNKIKHLVIQKNSGNLANNNSPIKISNGNVINIVSCVSFLKRLSLNELILELEYAHFTKNTLLEELVMNEYYKKQSKKLLV